MCLRSNAAHLRALRAHVSSRRLRFAHCANRSTLVSRLRSGAAARSAEERRRTPPPLDAPSRQLFCHCPPLLEGREREGCTIPFRPARGIGRVSCSCKSAQRAAAPERSRHKQSASAASASAEGARAIGAADRVHPRRYFLIPSSSTSKISVAFGGIGPPGVPRSPYARLGGQVSFALPPTFNCCTPSVQHLMTRFSGNSAG
jgi:hypothetical protein